MQSAEKIANLIDQLNDRVGAFASWCCGLLVLVVGVDVLLRSVFRLGSMWITELEWHIFSLIFLLGSGYALKHNRHVRVDLFYEKMSKKDRALVDLVGHLLFLLPWCALVLFAASQYAYQSFLIGETSDNPGGLPFRYIIKSVIVVAFMLLFLQGISGIIRSYLSFRTEDHTPDPK